MNEDLQDLIDAYFEGAACPEMLKALDQMLSEDEAVRIQFLHSANLIAELPLVLCDDEDRDKYIESTERKRTAIWRFLPLTFGVVALVVFLFVNHSKNEGAGRPSSVSLTLLEGRASFGERELKIGERCLPPGRIEAGTDAVVLRYPDGSLLTLEEGSALRLESATSKKVFLEHGSLLADMQPQNVGEEMIMDTTNSTVTVLGTRYRLATTIIEDHLEVEHGKVRLLEKKTNKELIATRGSSSRVPGVDENLFPTISSEALPQSGPRLPVTTYSPKRSWFTEDFDVPWSRGLWQIRIGDSPDFHQWTSPEPGTSIVESTNWLGFPTNALSISRPKEDQHPVCLRLSERVGWDCYFLKYYFQKLGKEPFILNPLCLELPEGTPIETIYESDRPVLFEEPDRWNRVTIQYLRFWNGTKWQIEVRKHINYEHRSTVRLDIERTPAILFQVESGSGLFDFISVGELTPAKNPFVNPFKEWLCTEDFEPRYNDTLWDVSFDNRKRFYPITSPVNGAILERAIGRTGKTGNVLALTNPSKTGVPNQLRLRRRIPWDDFSLEYYYRPTTDDPLIQSSTCLNLLENTKQNVVYAIDGHEHSKESGRWNKVRIEYHRFQKDGEWLVEARRILNDLHISTTHIDLGQIPTVVVSVESGGGIFDWIKIRKLIPGSEMAKSNPPINE